MLCTLEQCCTTSVASIAESKVQDDQERRNALKMAFSGEQTQKSVLQGTNAIKRMHYQPCNLGNLLRVYPSNFTIDVSYEGLGFFSVFQNT